MVTRSFIRNTTRYHGPLIPKAEEKWIRTVYGAILKVARSQDNFIMDDIWKEIDALYAKDKLEWGVVDHRILGPMLRHMVAEGLISSTGYYVKSSRPGGGSRPITIWESYIREKVAA